MPRMTSDLTEVEEREPLPVDKYKAQIDKVVSTESKEAKNPMLVLDYKVIDNPNYANRKLMFDNVMIGGKQKDGAPMNTFRLADLIQAFKLPWSCLACGNAEQARDFLKGSGPGAQGGNDLPRGKYFCPDCHAPMKITYDTDTWPGSVGGLVVSIEAIKDSDRKRNKIDGYFKVD